MSNRLGVAVLCENRSASATSPQSWAGAIRAWGYVLAWSSRPPRWCWPRASVVVWWKSTGSLVEAGDTVSMAGGELTFQAPAGWSRDECPAPDPGCLYLRPPGDAGADRITVLVLRNEPNAREGDISVGLLEPGIAPAGSHFTVDGVDFVRDS